MRNPLTLPVIDGQTSEAEEANNLVIQSSHGSKLSGQPNWGSLLQLPSVRVCHSDTSNPSELLVFCDKVAIHSTTNYEPTKNRASFSLAADAPDAGAPNYTQIGSFVAPIQLMQMTETCNPHSHI